MDRFYVDHLFQDDPVLVDKEEIKHITKVLRFSVGDCVEIFDSSEREYIAEIIDINSSKITFIIREELKRSDSMQPEIILYQGIAKGSRMDFLIQKSTELGIDKIVPVRFERCVAKLDDHDKKLDRWNKICLEACKQSKRNKISVVENAVNFDVFLKELSKNDLNLFFYEKEEKLTLKEYLKNNLNKINLSGNKKKIGIVVGPEGGITEEEQQQLCEMGVPSLTLGKRILRTETVGMAVLSILQYELE